MKTDLGAYKERDLPALADLLLQSHLQVPFGVSLVGSLGAGKTSLVRHLLHRLGLPLTEPVQSPTFTYLNEYRIGDQWYAHFDFYRWSKASSDPLIDSFGNRSFSGIFVEWVEQLADLPAVFYLTHELTISGEADNERRYYLKTWAR